MLCIVVSKWRVISVRPSWAEIEAMQTWKTQLRKGIVELCVMGVLQRKGEAYGYELLQALQGVDGLSFSESTVYPVLARLSDNGMIAARTEPFPRAPRGATFA